MKERLTDIEPTIVITMEKGLPEEEARDFLKALCVHAKSWSGEGDYRFVVRLRLGINTYCTIPVHDFAGTTCRVPHDPEHMDMLILNFPKIATVKFDLKFDRWADWYGDKPKPQTRVKSYKSTNIEDLPPGDPKYDFLDCEAAWDERKRLRSLLNGYPFDDLSPVENKQFIYEKVINPMRTDWPFLYELDRIIGGKFTDAYRLLAEPDNHRKLGEHWLSVTSFCHPERQTYMYEQIASHIKNDIFIFTWKEERARREQKYGRRPGYRPITEEDSGDRYLELASASVGQTQYDPSLDDDTPKVPTKIVVKNKYAR